MESPEGARENTWDYFQNPHLRKEIDRLSDEERQCVDETVEALVRDVELFQIACSVPHGSKELARIDQFFSCRIDENGPPTDPQTLGVQLVNSLSPAFQDAVLTSNEGQDGNVIQVFQHPTDAGKVIIKCITGTPSNVSGLSDGRASFNFYRLIVSRAAVQRFLEQGKIPLWPFVLRHAAAILNPKAAQVFFDVPMQGVNGLLDKNDNPTTMMDYETKHVVHYPSTKNNHTVPSVNEHLGDDDAFIARARSCGLFLYSIYPTNAEGERMGNEAFQQQQSELEKQKFLLMGKKCSNCPDASQFL